MNPKSHQGRVIRKHKIPFRYDWEKVVTPSDGLCDLKRLALMGISMAEISFQFHVVPLDVP